MSEGTGLIYYEDPHITEFEGTVVSSEWDEKQKAYAVVLDRTAFFPEQGGQSADRGTLAGQEVLDVRIRGGIITHYVRESISPGTRAAGSVDWERRFEFMQQHTGEHMFSGLMHRHFGFDNVGFRLGDRETTLDFNGVVSPEELCGIEEEVNRAVWRNLPVRVSFPEPEVLESLDYRSKLELTHDVRIVEIPGIDMCACCAPHCDTTAQVGLLKVVNAQHYKGGIRVTIACGIRALRDYSEKQESVTGISVLLSAKQAEVLPAVTRLREKAQETEHLLRAAGEKLLLLRAESLPGPEESPNALIFADAADPNTMKDLVTRLSEKYPGFSGVFAGSDEAGYRFVIGSLKEDCSELAKELRKEGYKAGGGKTLAQGSVQKTESEIRARFL